MQTAKLQVKLGTSNSYLGVPGGPPGDQVDDRMCGLLPTFHQLDGQHKGHMMSRAMNPNPKP